ncbi:MAG: NAD(P)-dependent alcohol dehydrogenase [Acidimicrobiales bacterium]
MQAAYHNSYREPDAVEIREIDVPAVGVDEVLIRVRAAGVNRGDTLAVAGLPYAARLAYGVRHPRRPIPGTDAAGVVEAVGSRVEDLTVGDAVFGWVAGAFASHAAGPASRLRVKPAHLSFEQAAAIPTTAVAALQAVRDVGRIRPGHHVLVVGASGGVGSFAVQIAKALGADVTGVASTRNVELVRSTGADRVIDYTKDDFTDHRGCYDLVVDLVGGVALRSAQRVVRPGGTYVVVGGGNARSVTGMSRFAAALALSAVSRQRLRPLFASPSGPDLDIVRTLVDEGRVLPVIDAVHDLRDAPMALAHVARGHTRGRVVLTV